MKPFVSISCIGSVRNFFASSELLNNEYKDVNFVQDNAVEYLYFDFFSDITNLESVSESRRKILHGLEWIEDEIFERGTLNEVVHDAGH